MTNESPARWERCAPELRNALESMRAALAQAEWKLSPVKRLNWQKEIEKSSSPGVYLIFDEGGLLIYIGKAERPLGSEVWSKFRRGESDTDLRWKDGPEDQARPHSISTIKLSEGDKYLAPALEGILIRELNPSLNVLKKKK